MDPAPRRRQAARVVVLDAQNRVLLIEAVDPADPTGGTWWEIPGGGMHFGEPSAHAAARELREEAGIIRAEIGPVVWTQSVQFTFAGLYFDQDEFIHIAWTNQADLQAPMLESLEALAFQQIRWWTVEEVTGSDSRFLPPQLPFLLPSLVAGHIPESPIDITHLGQT